VAVAGATCLSPARAIELFELRQAEAAAALEGFGAIGRDTEVPDFMALGTHARARVDRMAKQ
jgi:hypothetical protein